MTTAVLLGVPILPIHVNANLTKLMLRFQANVQFVPVYVISPNRLPVPLFWNSRST